MPNKNYREAVKWVQGLPSLGPVVVYRPIIKRFYGQKLRVVVVERFEGAYKFSSAEQIIWRNIAAKCG